MTKGDSVWLCVRMHVCKYEKENKRVHVQICGWAAVSLKGLTVVILLVLVV